MENKASFFTTYEQQENRTTNYCLLMLNQIYSYSPILFNQLISNLILDECNFGVNFNQQKGINTSKNLQIADGIIRQEEITIYIETKNFDWFYDNQIFGYLDNLNNKQGKKILILLSNFENINDIQTRSKMIKQSNSKYYDIEIYPINFTDLYSEITNITDSIQNDMFKNMVNDFEAFLFQENLLPTWQYKLDIVRTGDTMEQNKQYECYCCPCENGTWWHRRAKYMGLLNEGKILKTIAEIDGVVNVVNNNNQEFEVMYDNINDRKNLENRARDLLKNSDFYGSKHLQENDSVRIFLLSNIKELNEGFEKDSKGGRLPGKMYIDLSKDWKEKPNNIDKVEKLIDGKKWSDFQ
ncbi:hypothetical protein HDR59_03065 [bacterium]|nr:hypothetical protein [bacterium]